MRIIWAIIPGTALVNAPARKAEIPKLPPLAPTHENIAAPHTSLPAIIAKRRVK